MAGIQPRRRALELRHEVSEGTAQDDAGHCREKSTVYLRHPIGAEQKHAAGLAEPACPQWLLHET
jgi:hypothetical protein